MRSYGLALLLVSACVFDRPSGAPAPALDTDASSAPDAHAEADASFMMFNADASFADANGDHATVDAGIFEHDAGIPADAGEPQSPGCTVTLCIGASGARDEDPNALLGEICRQAPGNIEDCGLFDCLPLFPAYQSWRAYDALFDRLDTDDDNVIGPNDEACAIQLVGYSWGGGDALEVATELIADARITPSKKRIAGLVLLVPYRPFTESFAIPDIVARHWTYRHTIAPFDDCTADSLGGPFLGIGPACSTASTCVDYDYSADLTARYHGVTRDWLASEIDHCTIADAAGLAVLHNLLTGTAANGTPPERMVPAL